jgi:O-methyltransferase
MSQIVSISESIRKKFPTRWECQTPREFFYMYHLIDECNNIDGAFAEIGAYQGFTSEFIFLIKKKEKRFFVCDTFTGLRDVGEHDRYLDIPNGGLSVGVEEFCNMNDFVKEESVALINGYFPDSATSEMNNSTYSFVHIDTDTHDSTKNSLHYFYPKMAHGGKILVHDYRNHQGTKGVAKAVDDFMIDKEDSLMTHEDSTQAIITKI